jgi:hypothetical protein
MPHLQLMVLKLTNRLAGKQLKEMPQQVPRELI